MRVTGLRAGLVGQLCSTCSFASLPVIMPVGRSSMRPVTLRGGKPGQKESHISLCGAIDCHHILCACRPGSTAPAKRTLRCTAGRLDPSLRRCMAGMDYQHVHGSDDPHDDLRYRQRTLQCQALVHNWLAQALRPAGAPEAASGAKAYLWLRTHLPSLGHSAALAAPHQRRFLDAGGGGCPCSSPS